VGFTCTLDGNGNSVGAGTQLVLTQPFASAMLQYNLPSTTWSYFNWFGTNGAPFSVLYTGTASQPTLSVLGIPFSGGSGTTTQPQVYLSNTGASAVSTWSTSGTYIGINGASGFTGNFFDFHVNGGASVASLSAAGALTVASCSGCGGGAPGWSTVTAGANAATGAFSTAGPWTFSVNGAASTPGLTISGTPFSGGSTTTTFPQFYINSGTAPTSFSTAGTMLGLNSPSGFGGNAIDVHANGGGTLFKVSGSGAVTTTSNFTSSVATGTAPLVVTSTTTVPNLTVSNHPKAQFCGTTSSCSATAETSPQIVYGSAPLVTGTPSTVTITGISPAFTSSTSYKCTVSDSTSVANALFQVTYVSGSSFTITGGNALTDTVAYICVGN
jgi:hypothetical protein